ncbi:lysozyme inhibitor LprI family protein [Burkholderia anthina]|uniref:lysozyme inhibitor LprI family protein n=1 Tax=Burkholderia anthina TaxID=179879 RepID=UPI00333FE72D
MQNTQNRPIWNPSTAVSLSVVLTPAFGSYLHASNWRTLGQPERAAASKVWFYVSLLILAAMGLVAIGLVGKTDADKDAIRGAVNIGGLIYFVVWYVLSGRKQVSYVKEQFGKTYAKKSLVKPLLVAFACVIAYAAAIFGLLVATHGGADANGAATDQSPGGSSFSLASLFGSGNKLDCAAPNVKNFITDSYADQLVQTGIPDLVTAVQRKRITFGVEMIAETGRNTESNFVTCRGNLVITFPSEDLEKARKLAGDGLLSEAVRKTGAVFNEEIAYKVSALADKSEKKDGPLVEISFVNARDASDSFAVYGAAYGALAYTAPDISASSKNTQKWDRDFKDAALQACGKQANLDLCQCRLDEFEKLLSQADMQRIGYMIQTKSLDADKYPNFVALSQSLSKQCPIPTSASAVSAPAEQEAAISASDVATQQTSDASSQVQQEAPKSAVVEASFDCGKATSKIEKLICSTPATADADRRLAAAYRVAVAKTNDPAGLKQQQRDWLKERNACDDAACLVRVTDARIQALSAM